MKRRLAKFQEKLEAEMFRDQEIQKKCTKQAEELAEEYEICKSELLALRQNKEFDEQEKENLKKSLQKRKERVKEQQSKLEELRKVSE